MDMVFWPEFFMWWFLWLGKKGARGLTGVSSFSKKRCHYDSSGCNLSQY